MVCIGLHERKAREAKSHKVTLCTAAATFGLFLLFTLNIMQHCHKNLITMTNWTQLSSRKTMIRTRSTSASMISIEDIEKDISDHVKRDH